MASPRGWTPNCFLDRLRMWNARRPAAGFAHSRLKQLPIAEEHQPKKSYFSFFYLTGPLSIRRAVHPLQASVHRQLQRSESMINPGCAFLPRKTGRSTRSLLMFPWAYTEGRQFCVTSRNETLFAIAASCRSESWELSISNAMYTGAALLYARTP